MFKYMPHVWVPMEVREDVKAPEAGVNRLPALDT